MSDFKLEFTLRQETPIIHFLHDQPGAVLRATELKPKLDAFLKKKISPDRWNPDWEIKRDDNGHLSLDYKIAIRPIGKQHDVRLDVTDKIDRETRAVKYETSNYPHLLANMGGKEHQEDLKNLVMYDGVEISIRSWHDDLLGHIETQLPQLIANTNFGNRSGKGFGSFTCTAVNGAPPQRLSRPEFRYCFDRSVKGESERDRQKDLFSAINWFYKCLRSGINQVNKSGETEFYFKSLMFAFANHQGEKWDKYSIKNYFFTGGQLPPNKVDYRDWLGLSTEEMWGRKYGNQVIKKESPQLDRFPSPLFFKPVRTASDNRFNVYFGAMIDRSAFDTFRGATIKVTLKGKPLLELRPTAHFNFDDFLRFSLEEIDIQDHLFAFDRDNKNDTRYWIYRDFIQPIFSSIRQNLQRNG